MQAFGMPGHVIRRLHQHSTQIFTAHVRDAGFDVTPVQFAALDALFVNPGIDQARLAGLIACDRVTVGAVVDRLETRGLIERAVSQRDRRAKILRLTEEGGRTYQALLGIVSGVQDEILAQLAPAERARFLSLAQKAIGGGIQF